VPMRKERKHEKRTNQRRGEAGGGERVKASRIEGGP